MNPSKVIEKTAGSDSVNRVEYLSVVINNNMAMMMPTRFNGCTPLRADSGVEFGFGFTKQITQNR